MGAKLLEVDGTTIKFICEVKKQSTSSVHLSNISDEYVAFKVKTTSPKRFCVRPNSGIISPKSSCDFTVTMQGLRSAPSDVECKDKFLIQSTIVDSGTKEEDVTLDLFSKSSGKYVEEKKLRVVLASKQDSPVKEETLVKKEEHRNKVLEEEPSNEPLVKEETLVKKEEQKNKVVKQEPLASSKEDILVKKEEHKNKVGKEDISVKKEEQKNKLVKQEPSALAKEDILVKKEEHKNKVLKQEPPASVKEETLVKNDENVSHSPKQKQKDVEVKSTLTTEEVKPSVNDVDENVQNVSKNLDFIPIKIVKEDPQRKLRLSHQLKELNLKEKTLENQLKEAKSTISSLTYQNSIVIEAKETLQLELARRSKKGFPFVVVCAALLTGVIGGYVSNP